MDQKLQLLGPVPRALLFDVDGVMVDVRQSYRQAILATVRYFGGNATEYDILTVKLAGNANNDWQVTQTLLAQQGIIVEFSAVKAKFEEYYQGTSETPGLWRRESMTVSAREYEVWSQRMPCAIVTGRPRGDAQRFLQHFELAPFFSAVVCMEDAPLKPSPAPALRALAQLALVPGPDAAIWMLGDTPDDMRCAVGAGCKAVGIMPPGESSRAVENALLSAGASIVFENLGQFFDALAGRWRQSR